MNEQSIQEQYQQIVRLLMQKRLKEAQTQLEAFLWDSGDWEQRTRLEQNQTAYQYMLQYMKQGVNDPERPRLHTQLQAEAWEIADQTRISLLDKVSSRYYNLQRNSRKKSNGTPSLAESLKTLEAFPDDMAICQLMPDNRHDLDNTLKRHEDAEQQLFLTVWSNSAWSVEEEKDAQCFLASELLPANDLCLFTSAVTLSLMECFDTRKFAWLLDACNHSEIHVSQRARVGIALAMHCHPHRLPLYPDLTARLSLLDEDGKLGKDLTRINIQLLRSQETEKINRKMREEIIPEMMKNMNIMRNMKFGFEDPADGEDRNPEWEKAFEHSGLENKIREMNELQTEGADVYMATFAQLKGYSFFKQLSSWFLPFDPQHSAVIREFGTKPAGGNSLLSLILQTGFFCDSDKYSLCLTMSHIPQSQRDIMLNQMTSQDLNALMDESKSASLKQQSLRAEVISNLYIHDLYRFFKLNSYRSEMRDIFKEELALYHIPALKELLCKPELLKETADFLFRKEHTTEALEIYQKLMETNRADAETFQKAGYCLQKEKRYKEAVEAYRKADLLKPDQIWTIRHLAACYRQMKDFTSALEYYKKTEAMQPENHNTLFFIGSCLAEQKCYDEALQYFFKLDFVEEECVKAWRAIGWCSFVSGKYEQAARYCHKLLDKEPLATDYLNAGHVAWRQGNLEQAVEHYGKAVLKSGSKANFLEMFHKDRETLLEQGIAEEDIPLVLDMV